VKVPRVSLPLQRLADAEFDPALPTRCFVRLAAPPRGRGPREAYTYRSLCRSSRTAPCSISNGQSSVIGYANLESNEVYYTGGTETTKCASRANPYGSPNCKGLYSELAIYRIARTDAGNPATRRPRIGLLAVRRSPKTVAFCTGWVLLMPRRGEGRECVRPEQPDVGENH